MRDAGQRKSHTNKTGRLKKRPEFLSVAKNDQKWVSDSVIVQSAPTNDGDIPRFGYTATKKIGNAVIRNRAKRRLRAAIDDIVKHNIIQSADIVLIARNTTPTNDWQKLTKDLCWCLKRLNLIKKSS